MPTQLTKQEQLFGVRDADVGTLRAKNERLYPFFKAAQSLAKEVKVDPTDGGLSISAVDGANVGMVNARVDLDGDVPDDTFGINLKRLVGQLQNKPREATIEIDCALPYGVLRLEEEFANGRVWNIRERVSFLDPDSIRERPDLPDLEFDMEMEMPANDLSRILSRLPDGRPVEFDVSDGQLSIGSITAASEDEAGQYDALAETWYEGDGEGTSLYSYGYLSDIVSGIKATKADTMRMMWSEEFPLRVVADGEYVSSEWFLAPRVKPD